MGGSSMVNQLVRCKKHPKHRQSPGVCSVCLTERLLRLYITSSKKATASSSWIYSSSSSSSSPYSSAASISSSSYSSPLHHYSTFSMPLSGINTKRSSSGAVMMMMMRSRSIAAPYKGSKRSNNNNKGGCDGEGKINKRGFWWKLLGLSAGKRKINNNKDNDQLSMVHSNSMREKRAKMHYY